MCRCVHVFCLSVTSEAPGYKYPMIMPSASVLQKVREEVQEAEPPNFQDQGKPKGRKKRAEEDVDSADEAEEQDTEAAIKSMEKLCLREAQAEAKKEFEKDKKKACVHAYTDIYSYIIYNTFVCVHGE